MSYEEYVKFLKNTNQVDYIVSWGHDGVIKFNSQYDHCKLCGVDDNELKNLDENERAEYDICYYVHSNDNEFEESLTNELQMINFLANRLEPEDLVTFYNYDKIFIDCGNCNHDCGLGKFTTDGCCNYVLKSRNKKTFTPEILEYIDKVTKSEIIEEHGQEFFEKFVECQCGECHYCTEVKPWLGGNFKLTEKGKKLFNKDIENE